MKNVPKFKVNTKRGSPFKLSNSNVRIDQLTIQMEKQVQTGHKKYSQIHKRRNKCLDVDYVEIAWALWTRRIWLCFNRIKIGLNIVVNLYVIWLLVESFSLVIIPHLLIFNFANGTILCWVKRLLFLITNTSVLLWQECKYRIIIHDC